MDRGWTNGWTRYRIIRDEVNNYQIVNDLQNEVGFHCIEYIFDIFLEKRLIYRFFIYICRGSESVFPYIIKKETRTCDSLSDILTE